MTVLVAGAREVDAGKTTFSTGLLARTGAVGFKPRAGNDRWFDHDDYRHAVEQGRLFGKDARRLAAASPGDLAPEAINPVHRLWEPTPGRSGPLGREGRTFLVDRAGDRYVVNGDRPLPDRLREHLPLAEAVAVDSLPALNRAMEAHHLPAIEAVGEDIAAVDRAVMESYGDVARPLQDLGPDAVAVVEPTRVRVVDGDRYRKGCAVAAGGPREGQLEEHVGDVMDLVDPVATVDLPALSTEERSDPETVARACGAAYDELLAAAGW